MELTGRVEDGKVVLDQKCDAPNGTPATVHLQDGPQRGQDVPTTPANGAVEPSAELDVETDVWVAMPMASEVLATAKILPGRRLRPCVILPEDADV